MNNNQGFTGLNIQQPGGQPQFAQSPQFQQAQDHLTRLQNQLSQAQGNPQQAFQQPQPQQPAPQQPSSLNMPMLGVLEEAHALLESYRSTNEKAYPDNLRQQMLSQIDMLKMFQERMNKLPGHIQQQMQNTFVNMSPYFEKQQ